ncbi:MAG: hypothetical protein RLZZ524_641 [Pseudomonadota bacterium]|jgi:hypothetical protein
MSHVTVSWSEREQVSLSTEGGQDALDARRWLDEQFIALDCEPLRASGKVLVADKLLALAATGGPEQFADAAWAARYAQAAVAASGHATVRVDVGAGKVSY